MGIVLGICGRPGEEEWFLALGAAAARVPAEGEDFPEDDEFDGDQAFGKFAFTKPLGSKAPAT